MLFVYEIPAGPVQGVGAKKEKSIKEPSIIIRPIGRLGGLDSLHVTLLVVIALLFLIVLVVSYLKPVPIANLTMSNATHNSTQIDAVAERFLASYVNVNGSDSLLPFITNVSTINATYVASLKSWYVSMSAKDFGSKSAFELGLMINDLNTSQVTPLIEAAKPSQISENYVAADGVVRLNGKVACLQQAPVQVYWFIDPYAVGSVASLLNATTLQQKFGTKLNLSVRVITGSATEEIGSSAGLSNAQLLGAYTLCASQQSNFDAYVSNLNSLYSGSYMPGSVLANIANFSKLNQTQLGQCLADSPDLLYHDGLLASYYNVTQTPAAVVDCQYLAIPQTASDALCYANSTLC